MYATLSSLLQLDIDLQLDIERLAKPGDFIFDCYYDLAEYRDFVRELIYQGAYPEVLTIADVRELFLQTRKASM